MTGFGKIGLITGWVKIEFLPEKASISIACAKYERCLYLHSNATTLNSRSFTIITFFNVLEKMHSKSVARQGLRLFVFYSVIRLQANHAV